MTNFVKIGTKNLLNPGKLTHSFDWLLILRHFAHQSSSSSSNHQTTDSKPIAGFIYKLQFLKISLKKSVLKSITAICYKNLKNSCNLKKYTTYKIHKNEVQNNTMKYDFTMNIFTQFSPCTGPLINKINNINIVRNLHLFREYTQQFTATTTKNPSHKGRHTTCLSHRPKVSACWSAERSKHWLNATWLYTVRIPIGWKVVASDYVFPTRK
jgi:hypothetical protein